jgi:L-alanine-DL-glutamate epimerase-like enolase superfamily enzyme
MSPRIRAIRTRRLDIPLSRPWGPDVTSVGVIAVEVDRDDDVTGHGFSWTPSIGAGAAHALLAEDITAAAIGRSAAPGAEWDALWTHLHEAGGGGLTTIALAGLDLALWDAEARARDTSLTDLLGARHSSLAVYGSGVNLHLSLAELQEQARRWVAAGYGAIKMKVGRPVLEEDLERVAAVRVILGPDRALRVDANQRWDLPTALVAVRELGRLGIDWIEEPLRADDLDGHRRLRAAEAVPIAVGENLHTRYRFAEYLDAGACDILQPNIVRVGGITPFLRIAELVTERDARLAPHLLPELSGQVALALPTEVEIEDVEDAAFGASGALDSPPPVTISNGRLQRSADAEPGLGMRFSARA